MGKESWSNLKQSYNDIKTSINTLLWKE
jgi:hypothetical protein